MKVRSLPRGYAALKRILSCTRWRVHTAMGGGSLRGHRPCRFWERQLLLRLQSLCLTISGLTPKQNACLIDDGSEPCFTLRGRQTLGGNLAREVDRHVRQVRSDGHLAMQSP